MTRVELITVSRVCAPSPGSAPGSTPAPGTSSDAVSVSTWFCFSRHHKVFTRTDKPGIIGRHFPVRQKSGNFKQTEKVREFQTNVYYF